MTIETLRLHLEEERVIALEELLVASGLAREELVELVEFGVLEPAADAWRFPGQALRQARRAARLRDDFGLNAPGMALALAYLERIDVLERRLRELECQLLG
jgi:chaperone modulatory protein CbpM